jgi:hypothetical protein
VVLDLSAIQPFSVGHSEAGTWEKLGLERFSAWGEADPAFSLQLISLLKGH